MGGGGDLEQRGVAAVGAATGRTDRAGAPPSRPGRARWLLAGGVAVALLGLLAMLGYGLARQQGVGGLAINATGQIGRVRPGSAPDFAIPLYDGPTFRLSEQRGKVVVVNFWASWCPPCREEAPVLERAWRRYRDRQVVFVGLDLWDSEKDGRAFIRQFGITYPNGPDAKGVAAIDYGLTGLPETFFIRPDGTVARHWIGPLTDAQINAFIEEALR